MNSSIAILERLLEDETVTFKEHVLETASRHVADAQQKFEESFDRIVREISTIWGQPEFNSQIRKEGEESIQTASGEQKKSLSTVVPGWCQGTPKNGGIPKAIRLAHWKKPEGVMYIVLRTELDPEKDRALYYDLVLGARRRKPEVDRSTAQLRQQTGKPLMGRFIDFTKWLFGR